MGVGSLLTLAREIASEWDEDMTLHPVSIVPEAEQVIKNILSDDDFATNVVENALRRNSALSIEDRIDDEISDTILCARGITGPVFLSKNYETINDT